MQLSKSYLLAFIILLISGMQACGDSEAEPPRPSGDHFQAGDTLPVGGDSDPGPRNLDSIMPERGHRDGGTGVELGGSGFVADMTLLFGEAVCEGLVRVSPTKLSCYTPAASATGLVDLVALWPDGHDETLVAAFEYHDEVPQPVVLVDYCHLQYPLSLEAVAAEAELGPVFGWVYHAGITDAEGQQEQLRAQLGVGPRDSDPRLDAGWQWHAADFNERKPNDSHELVNYEYMSSFGAPAQAGLYDYAYRFSLDSGASWQYCHSIEGFGSNHADGYQPGHAGKLTVLSD